MVKNILVLLLTLTTSLAFAEERTLPQVLESLYGTSVENPDPNSLLGKYLAKTGAETVMRTFPTGPEANAEQGPARLVVAVGASTEAAFAEHFNNKNMLYLLQDPSGSMYAAYMGKVGNYAQLANDLSSYIKHTSIRGWMLVPIVLSDSEAERAQKYFDMGRDRVINIYAQQPWSLADGRGNHYSAQSGFRGCTSWFGTIPIGDTLVDSYIFPSEDKDGMTPRIQPLMEYVTSGVTPEQEKTIRSVWKIPGHQQLGELLNPMANRRGEFTNAGWIAYSLLGKQGVDRVPLVFLITDNEKAKIDPKYTFTIYAY